MTASRPPPRLPAIHQVLPRLAWGDAVGNQVRYLQGLLRRWGHASDIYADAWDDACKDQVRPVKDHAKEAGSDSVLLVHHSFESRLVPRIARSPGRKVLVYHNVTPARLFEGFERKVAAACDAARDELLALRPHVEAAFAYSRFSAEELVAAGYPNVAVLPFAIDWAAFDTAPEAALQAELDDGMANILFVGRAVPSKKVDDVLRVFTAYQRLYQPRSRLVIAGALHRDGPYGAYLHGLKDVLGAERVLFLGRVSAAQLSACFATASAYLSMSRHEGFGVPLLEAMYRRVPVVAYGAAAVPETMGGAGLATLSDDPREVAQLLAVLDRNAGLRAQVIAAQRERLSALSQEAVAEQVRRALTGVLSGTDSGGARGSPSATVELMCPGFLVRAGSPSAQLARRLAARLPGARILALRPGDGGEAEGREGGLVTQFTPDQPVSRRDNAPLPGSSSMETAVRASAAPVVLLGLDTASAQTLLPYVAKRAWGVATSSAQPELLAAARAHLGLRTVVAHPLQTGATVETLLTALASKGVISHAP
ncbi:glycosyltransferase [Corallococcus macrosporus]|uniref:Glycosyl transferase family 1 n=1 Tax=Corallococcus macrosporus DSM 14697 TaxID=1189310 RepID=A0A250JZV3_9BACT|nr:glycosyltransferase [Corallococcus macrosporus]ATB48871.1 glycosyl transferase family 1 [Corallococcus macrosporus DSM 14697]